MADTDYVPVGAIVPLGCSLPDEDPSYMLCDGRELDSTAYAELFSAIGRTYGGDESRQVFNLPDLQGLFPRGADYKTGADPEARTRHLASGSTAVVGGVGTKQSFATAAPATHFTCVVDLPSGTSRQHGETKGGVMKEGGSKTIKTCEDGGDDDTRPVNVYVNYYIKYQS
jgi:hypothetical protein